MECNLYLLIVEIVLICDSHPEADARVIGPLPPLCMSAIYCACLNTLVINWLKNPQKPRVTNNVSVLH